MHREPKVLEAEAQVGDSLDCRSRIASKELAPIHSVKKASSRMLVLQDEESGCRFGEKCSYPHRHIDEQPSKGLKRMVTKVQWLC